MSKSRANVRYQSGSNQEKVKDKQVRFEVSRDYRHLRNLLLDLGTSSYQRNYVEHSKTINDGNSKARPLNLYDSRGMSPLNDM